MAGLQLSGLASGFDWKSVVDQLIALQRVPQTRLRTAKTENQTKLNTFGTLRTRITALQDAAKALSSDSVFGKRKTSFSVTDSTWRASASSGSALGEFTFNVSRLATRSVREGAADRAASLHSSNDVSELLVSELRIPVAIRAGTFSINGAQVTIEEGDTLQEVFDKISTEAGVTATYDATTDRVSLVGSGPLTLGSGSDTSNFLYALKLYNSDANPTTITSASSLGSLRLADSLADAGLATAVTADGDGNGAFTINGVTITYDLATDTLQSVINRVNESAAGVTLAYDAVNDAFRLTNDNTGDVDLTVSETTGNLLTALGLTTGATVTRGENAEFTVNGGGTIVSASNTLDESVHGVKGISVTVDSVAEQTVTIESDADSIKQGIRTFIDKFNDIQKLIDEQTKVTVGADGTVKAAPFANNRELSAMARELRGFVFNEVEGLSGTLRRLENIGIDFNGSSTQLSIRDEAKLDEALASNLGEVAQLFTKPTTGLTARLTEYLTRVTNNSGLVDTQETTLEKQNLQLDKQIADFERRLEAERNRLEASFIRMEEAQQLINNQLSALQQTLGL